MIKLSIEAATTEELESDLRDLASLFDTRGDVHTPAAVEEGSFTPEVATPAAPVQHPAAATPAAPAQPAPEPPAFANGLPWDARIHASSKALLKDGSWRQKRGVDAALVAQVEAELRAAAAQQTATQPPVAPLTNGAAPPTLAPTLEPALAPPGGAFLAQPAPAVAPITPPPGADPVANAIELAQLIITAPGATPEQTQARGIRVSAIFEASGLKATADLIHNPTLAPQIHEQLRSAAAELGVPC